MKTLAKKIADIFTIKEPPTPEQIHKTAHKITISLLVIFLISFAVFSLTQKEDEQKSLSLELSDSDAQFLGFKKKEVE